eukprot:scaffold3551_cov118-Isochrysis_galbana.AAC.4
MVEGEAVVDGKIWQPIKSTLDRRGGVRFMQLHPEVPHDLVRLDRSPSSLGREIREECAAQVHAGTQRA